MNEDTILKGFQPSKFGIRHKNLLGKANLEISSCYLVC